MTYLDFEKEYIKDRPIEPYSENEDASDWANLTRYAEDNLQKAFNLGYCECEKGNEWHNLNKNHKDLPNEGEWVEGLYIWYYKDEPKWDVFKVRWYHELGELDEKLVRWYSSDENNSCERDYWNKVDEPDYWRRIVLPTRNEYDRNY